MVNGILLLTDQFPPAVGGSGELLFNVYTRLGGPPVTVLTTDSGEALTQESDGLQIIRRRPISRRWGVMHPAGLSGHIQRTVELLRHSSGAQVVVHCGCALPEGLAAWSARRIGGPPYLCWVHGEELGYAASSRELRALMGLVLRGAAALVANSGNTAKELSAFDLDSKRISVVHPGVDPERFTPSASGSAELRRQLAPNGDAVVLTVGRLQRRKGHDLMIQALAELESNGRRVRYVIVGDGQERSRLEVLAESLKVRDRVVFVGRVAAESLPAYYAAADVFVHPNRVDGHDFEGFGIVFLEAAAAGLPVIAGNTGGAPEAVEHGRTGVTVSGLDAGELADALATLLDDAPKRLDYGRAGRHRVLTQFAWDRAAAAVKAIHETAFQR